MQTETLAESEERPRRPGERFAALRRHRQLVFVLAVVALLAQMAVAMVITAREQSPTIDEPVYVGTATVYLKERSLRYNPEHPPLGKLIIATGVLVADPHLGDEVPEHQSRLGRKLLYELGNDPGRLMFWARIPVIVLTLLFGLVICAFARDLTGRVGALVALALYTFSPDVIAHGSLATLDMPAAGFVLTSVWLTWRARRRPGLYLPLAGLALGAALATKMNTLVAVPVVLLLAVPSVLAARRPAGGDRRRRTARTLALGTVGWAAAMTLLAIAVVWASYLVVDPRLHWTPPADMQKVHGLRALATEMLPLPREYRDGMLIQFGKEEVVRTGFLYGRVYYGSLWYYLPAAFLVKTPLGMLVLWAAGAVALCAVRRLRPAAPYVLVPTAVLLVTAMTGTRDYGTRYAIFVPLFLAVAAAAVLSVRWRWAYAVTGALVAFVAGSSLSTFPYYLPYANEAFGGPANTHRWLHDSNVDWGQDLGRLADRLRERYPDDTVWLVYKGSGEPSYYGIHASDPLTVAPDEVRGLLVVSDSAAATAEAPLARLIDSSRAIDEVGHSITIYRRR
ncbi:ArnT family glycosyltransferase [Streptomyces blattellae]|uniref:ArnT family glycosyltransferase n=1 Tax=Streptomyces blattellae TaxID=2569855 RepID=UPI0038B5E668